MELTPPSRFSKNWKLKIISIIGAIFIWIFINQSITETTTLPDVAVRIIHLPHDKTVSGLLPTGYMSRRMTLFLSGSKRVIDELEASDVEVIIDASCFETNEWPVQITKKNLVSLNPDLDVNRHINFVDTPDWTIKLEPLVSAKVPIKILPPKGEVPDGYELLSIWPQNLTQVVLGPEEEIEKLKTKGLRLSLDLTQLKKQDLDAIKGQKEDEICFLPPEQWKQVPIPYRHFAQESINDPRNSQIKLDLIRKASFPLDRDIPIQVFYPQKWIDRINPRVCRIEIGNAVVNKQGVDYLSVPLFVKGVSRSFLDLIKDHLQIVLIAAPKQERATLQWNLEIVHPQELENLYVASQIKTLEADTLSSAQSKEELFRKRFREFTKKLTLYSTPENKLDLISTIDQNRITVHVR